MPLPSPVFPGALATVSDLLLQKNFLSTETVPTLASAIGALDGSFAVAVGTGANLPADNFTVTIDDEIIFVTSRTGDTCTVGTRGYEGTTGVAHSAGAQVNAFITAQSHNQLAAEVIAIETALGTGLDGIGGDIGGTYAATSVESLQGIPLLYAPAPEPGQVLQFDGVNWTPTNPSASVAQILYLNKTADPIGGLYKVWGITPDTSTETTVTWTGVSGDGTVEFADFITPSGYPDITLLPAGDWQYDIYAQVSSSSGTTNLILGWYKRAAGGTETLLLSQTINLSLLNTAVQLYSAAIIEASQSLSATDRLVLKLSANTTRGTATTVTVYIDGTTHYSHVHSTLGTGLSAPVQSVFTRTGNVVAATNDYAFLQLSDVTQAYTSAGGFAVQVNAGATGLEFVAKPVDLAFFNPGLGTNSQIIFRNALTRAIKFPASATLSQAVAGTGAAGTSGTAATYTFKKNGAAFATVVFDANVLGGTVGTWTQASDATFAAGDILELDGPATADTTLADFGITLAGVRV